MAKSLDTFKTRSTLTVDDRQFTYFDLTKLPDQESIARLPFATRILLENLLRHEDGSTVRAQDIEALIHWDPKADKRRELSFMPSRVVLQDFTGVPSVVDLAAMREAVHELGDDPAKINPLMPSELVIDHSVQVDAFGSKTAFEINSKREFERNRERYAFLRWGQKALDNFKVVPPATGIVHQVNLEYLARVVFDTPDDNQQLAYPDTLVGTDSHTTMINGIGVLGWGVGGIEAEAAMLGQPLNMLTPKVVGFELRGQLKEGATATDLVLRITTMLREHGVVGKFVEFYGQGIASLSLADRATISNMSPEFGSTCAIFPVDQETLHYLKFTGRSAEQLALVERYMKAQKLFHDDQKTHATYSEQLHLDLEEVEPALAGPKRPQDFIALSASAQAFESELPKLRKQGAAAAQEAEVTIDDPQTGSATFTLNDGKVVIAAITSCTNTSNPSVMLAAGLLAKKAVERGLRRQPWVKTSLAPGSKVVTEYLQKANLMEPLEELGYHLVGYGCTTCIGNSGPLSPEISRAIQEKQLVVCSVLSGNRNFEGRINPDTRANYLASPPLVVAYALAGRMNIDLYNNPIGEDGNGEAVYLRDIWPSNAEIRNAVEAAVTTEQFSQEYAGVYEGDEQWKALPTPDSKLYEWDADSTYIKLPSFFQNMPKEPEPLGDIQGMRLLAKLGDSVTTDHISPAGAIPKQSPAADYLRAHGVSEIDFNSFGSRRGNHEVMVRGTFGNIRLRNQLVTGVEGGYTRMQPDQEPLPIYDAAMKFAESKTPLLVVAGKEYGSGSSRDWAAKGTRLLGVRAVLVESFERIHRSNLIGMGVLPLQMPKGCSVEELKLNGFETFDLIGLTDDMEPNQPLMLRITADAGSEQTVEVQSRLDTPLEVTYYRHGGILHYVLRQLR